MTEKPKTDRHIMAQFMFALGELLLHYNVPADIDRVSVNFNGPQMRVDVATVTEDGTALDQWLFGLYADARDPARLGQRLPLPGMDGPLQ